MIISNKSFKEYLYKELSTYNLPLNIKSYLIDLLCFYLYSEQLFEKKNGETKSHEKTIIEWYKKSLCSSPREKLYLFKKIGDFSLYLSGFFREAVKKKLVHLSYYEEIGRTAYYYVSQSYPPKSNIFKDLAKEFPKISEILFFIQKRSSRQNQTKYLLNTTDKTSKNSENLH